MTKQNDGTEPQISSLTREQKKRLVATMARNELSNTMGVVNAIITPVIAFRWPQHFWIWHYVKTCVLITVRYFRFKRSSSQPPSESALSLWPLCCLTLLFSAF